MLKQKGVQLLNYVIKTTTYVDTRAAVTESTYDYAGRLLQTKHPDGSIERKEYEKGLLIKEIDANTRGTAYKYDVWGNVKTKTSDLNSYMDAQVKYDYDKNNKVTRESVRNNLHRAAEKGKNRR